MYMCAHECLCGCFFWGERVVGVEGDIPGGGGTLIKDVSRQGGRRVKKILILRVCQCMTPCIILYLFVNDAIISDCFKICPLFFLVFTFMIKISPSLV